MTHSKPPAPSLTLTVGEVAKRSGVAVSAVHFYERKGLISSFRSSGNQRRYWRSTLRRLAIIRIAQRLGISLGEIREAFDTLPAGNATAEDWNRLSLSWQSVLDNRLRQLEGLRDQLGHCIGCGCLSLHDCPLRNPNDGIAATGAGARFLMPS